MIWGLEIVIAGYSGFLINLKLAITIKPTYSRKSDDNVNSTFKTVCPIEIVSTDRSNITPTTVFSRFSFGYLLAGYFGFCALLLIVLSLVIYIGRETCARRLITPVGTYMYDTDEAEDHDEKDTENVESTAKSKRIKKNPPPFNPNKPSFKAWMMKRTAKVAPATSGVANKMKPV